LKTSGLSLDTKSNLDAKRIYLYAKSLDIACQHLRSVTPCVFLEFEGNFLTSTGRISSPKQPKDFSLEKTRSQLHLKTSKSENSLLSQTCLSVFESGAKQTIRPGLSSSGFEPNEASTPDSGTFDNVEADVKSGRLHRRMSEGN